MKTASASQQTRRRARGKDEVARGDLHRCLVVCPGSLVEQWQDELILGAHFAGIDAIVDAVSVYADADAASGVLLDPVYSAKAFAFLLRDPHYDGTRSLSLHTGGAPSLFAYGNELDQ